MTTRKPKSKIEESEVIDIMILAEDLEQAALELDRAKRKYAVAKADFDGYVNLMEKDRA